MKARSLTQSMSFLHTWGGLFTGWLLFVVLFTGAVAVYRAELTLWLSPEMSPTAGVTRAQALALGEAYLRAHAPHHRQWRIALPSLREPVVKVAWRTGPGGSGDARLDPRSGVALTRETEGGDFFLEMHEGLHIDRNKNRLGLYLVGFSGLAMLVGAISGVIVHKRIFKDLFLFRPRASRQRSWLDAHNLLGVLPLPFHVVMAYTGVLLLYWMFVPGGVQALYGGKEPPFRRDAITLEYQQPPKGPSGAALATRPLWSFVEAAEARLGAGKVGYLWIRDIDRRSAVVEAYRERTDRVSQQAPQIAFDGATGRVIRVVGPRSPAAEAQSAIAAVHWLEWGGAAVRLAYFVAGLAGAAAIACGLEVFVAKRRRRGEGAAPWMRAVEALNVAAVAGLAAACAAFLWAERLIPVGIAGRADAAVQIFWWAWLAAALHAAARGGGRAAWREQWTAAALLAFGAPWLGGLGLRDLATADGVRLGVDAGLLVLGAACAAIALRLWRGADAAPTRHMAMRLGA